MRKKPTLHRGSGIEREKRLKLLKSLESKLYSFNNFELKVILAISRCKYDLDDKDALVYRILTYIPSLEIKDSVNNISKIRKIIKFYMSLDPVEFDVLMFIYGIEFIKRTDAVLTIFSKRSIQRLKKDIDSLDNLRHLISNLKNISDYEFEILFYKANFDIKNVFRYYSADYISSNLSQIKQIRSFLNDLNKLSTYDLDYLLSIKSLECKGLKKDKIRLLIDKCSFKEIQTLLYDFDKIMIIQEELEKLNIFELNMILLLNGKSLSFSKENQILKIFKEIQIDYLKNYIIRVKHLNSLHKNEFKLIEEGLKKSSFKDLSKFIGKEDINSTDLKYLFEESFKIILTNYDVVDDTNIKKDKSNEVNQSDLDLFF